MFFFSTLTDESETPYWAISPSDRTKEFWERGQRRISKNIFFFFAFLFFHKVIINYCHAEIRLSKAPAHKIRRPIERNFRDDRVSNDFITRHTQFRRNCIHILSFIYEEMSWAKRNWQNICTEKAHRWILPSLSLFFL